MSFDQGNYNDKQSFPCECGGNITLAEYQNHDRLIKNENGEIIATTNCCQGWSCDLCDFFKSSCSEMSIPVNETIRLAAKSPGAR